MIKMNFWWDFSLIAGQARFDVLESEARFALCLFPGKNAGFRDTFAGFAEWEKNHAYILDSSDEGDEEEDKGNEFN